MIELFLYITSFVKPIVSLTRLIPLNLCVTSVPYIYGLHLRQIRFITQTIELLLFSHDHSF